MVLILISCEDSLGIEDNYSKKLIPRDTSNQNPPKPTKFSVDSLTYMFIEHYYTKNIYGDSLIPVLMPWEVTHYTIKAEMDTSKLEWAVWLDIKLSNRFPDNSYRFRDDRIINLKIKVDSINFNPSYTVQNKEILLNSGSNGGKWSELLCRRIVNDDTLRYTEQSARVRLSLNRKMEIFEPEGTQPKIRE